MTSEDDFQAALDTSPDDWQTRLVFADWLQERGDPRAEGYRALAVHRRIPVGVVRPDAWCDPGFLSFCHFVSGGYTRTHTAPSVSVHGPRPGARSKPSPTPLPNPYPQVQAGGVAA